MKKTYVKPTLNLESFVLTQSIAHNCGDNLVFSYATTKYKGQCGWNDGTAILWTGAGDGCNEVVGTDVEFVGLCYNNPDGGFNIFNS